jgi:cell division protein FtsI (penicillin-binding protein 3)
MESRPQGPNARLVAVGVALVLAWTMVGYRLTVVQGARAEAFAARGLDQRLQRLTLAADRGTIFDRDGRELAVTVDSVTVYANPREVTDPLEVARTLAPLLGREVRTVADALATDSEFVYLARQLDLAAGDPIREADLPGVYLLIEPKRVYPAGDLTAHVVGFVRDGDNVGLEGLELYYDTALAGHPGSLIVERDPSGRAIPQGEYQVEPAEPGSDLVLTIKTEIQFAAAQALAAAIARTGATSGSVVVLDPETGAILAMVNLPSFDPTAREGISAEALRNRAVTDVFEPGSTQKLVTISAALESGLVNPGTSFEIPEKIEILDTVFEDFTEHAATLTVTEIVTHSSNLGTILIGEELGARRLHSFMVAFGEGTATGVDFPGEAPGMLRAPDEWCITTCIAGTSIGYRVSVTALQMAMVYAAVANDGVWVQPHFVAETVAGDGTRVTFEAAERRVLSPATAAQMRSMLEAVVQFGTGTAGAVTGYRVGGKTGTTEKYLESEQAYSDTEVVASFIGIARSATPVVVASCSVRRMRPGAGAAIRCGALAALGGRVLPLAEPVTSFLTNLRRQVVGGAS